MESLNQNDQIMVRTTQNKAHTNNSARKANAYYHNIARSRKKQSSDLFRKKNMICDILPPLSS